jgi:WD40 repeat protein
MALCAQTAAGQERVWLVPQLGHQGWIAAAAFSPDGRYVLTGSWDRTARLWEIATGKELRRFEGHTSAVLSVAFSSDGRYVLTGSGLGDYSVRLWDTKTGKEVRRFVGHGGDVKSVAFSIDGQHVMTGAGSFDRSVRLWNMNTGKELRRLGELCPSPESIAFSRDNRYVLVGGEETTVRMWDMNTSKQQRQFVGHSAWVYSVAFSPDGRYVLTGGGDKTARLWEASTGREVRRFEPHTATVAAVAFSPDGRYVLTGSDKDVRLWDPETGKELRRFEGHSGQVDSVAFSPNGDYVLTASWDSTARLWKTNSGKELRRFESHADSVESVAFSPDGRHVLTGGGDGSARLWEMDTGRELRRLHGHSRPPFSVDSSMARYTGDFDPKISVAFSPDGRYLLTGGDDAIAWLSDASTGKELRFFCHNNNIMSVAFSPDGQYVLTGSGDNTARVWEAASGEELRRFCTDSGAVNSVAFSSDGHYLLTGSYGIARLWDAATGKEVRRFKGNPFELVSAAFSPDGRQVLVSSLHYPARLWEAATGEEIRSFDGSSIRVRAATFSSDGRYLLTGSSSDDEPDQNNTARLFDAKTGQQLRRYAGHTRHVLSVAFSPDTQYLLTGSDDGTTKFWETATGRELATLISFKEGGWAVTDPEGRFDTSDLDGGAPLIWVADSEPMRPLPLEIFMRDYYTPRLLARILKGERLLPVRPIGEIKNRVQPEVEIVKAEPSPGDPSRAEVSVRVASRTEHGQASGVQDLRLFRDGQMVGYREGALKDGVYSFPKIQLPLFKIKVTFTAYAFNAERIKSPTVSRDIDYGPAQPPRPKAYLVQIGVNHYQAAGCELHFAVNDADQMRAVLEDRLKSRGLDVSAVELTSTPAQAGVRKEDIRRALAAIAARATPDDVLFVSFSGHGYTAADGMFYLLPSDIEGSCRQADARLLRNAISADELAAWFRPIDAGEMTLILDSCYSAKSVESNDFKPGPMGSQGLGQLAYDKRMRILAASQSDETAGEDARLGQGLLSYVLTQEGLVEKKADWKPKDGKITVGEWLTYAADEVPKLGASAGAGTGTSATKKQQNSSLPPSVRGFVREEQTRRYGQVPAVFDFSKKDEFVLQQWPTK